MVRYEVRDLFRGLMLDLGRREGREAFPFFVAFGGVMGRVGGVVGKVGGLMGKVGWVVGKVGGVAVV
jgi:hypothetical protein